MINNQVNKAVKVLNYGGIIIYPTDTAFGIGCRIDNNQAINKLFNIRKRPPDQAVPVLVDSINMAQKYLFSPLPNNVRHLMNDFWPGGITVVYYCQVNKINPLVRGGGKTLGVRMPDNENILDIIKKTGVPILGPSANFHGDPTPYDKSDLNPDLVKGIDFVVSGKCKLNQSSTVIDTVSLPWRILRHGKTEIDIKKYL